MRPTRRGWAVAGVVVAALALAAGFGPRSLNAVAAPLLAVLGLGAWQLHRASPPAVSVAPVPAGYPGDERTLSISLEGTGVTVVQPGFDDGLEVAGGPRALTPPGTLEWSLRLQRRGRYDFDGLAVRQRDALGLVERSTEPAVNERVLVYPAVYPLRGDRRLERLFADVLPAERQEFERLREYEAGDPLRNIDWKSSAKHDEYMVVEFAPTRRNETVTIAAEATGDAVDEMASAAASVVVAAVSAGLGVAVTVPGGHLPAGQGETHRTHALRLLATTGPGTVPPADHEEADVSIRSDATGTDVRIGRSALGFAALRAGKQPATAMAPGRP